MNILCAVIVTAIIVSCVFLICWSLAERCQEKEETIVYIDKTPYRVKREVEQYISNLRRLLDERSGATANAPLDPRYTYYKMRLDQRQIIIDIANTYKVPRSDVELGRHPITNEIVGFVNVRLPFTRILVGMPSYRYLDVELSDCLSELKRKGIPILQVTRTHHTIRTRNCEITFVTASKYDKLRGLTCDICFYFDNEAKTYFHYKLDGDDRPGTFLDYVYEIEGVKE